MLQNRSLGALRHSAAMHCNVGQLRSVHGYAKAQYMQGDSLGNLALLAPLCWCVPGGAGPSGRLYVLLAFLLLPSGILNGVSLDHVLAHVGVCVTKV